jgi:hypothetical protein
MESSVKDSMTKESDTTSRDFESGMTSLGTMDVGTI